MTNDIWHTENDSVIWFTATSTTLQNYRRRSEKLKSTHENKPVVYKMNSRWNHFNTFKLFSNFPTRVVYTKITARWQVQEYKNSTFSEQPLSLLLWNIDRRHYRWYKYYKLHCKIFKFSHESTNTGRYSSICFIKSVNNGNTIISQKYANLLKVLLCFQTHPHRYTHTHSHTQRSFFIDLCLKQTISPSSRLGTFLKYRHCGLG